MNTSGLRQLLDQPQGKFIVFGALVLLILAFTYGMDQAYIMFALVLCIPLASYCIARATPARLRVTRTMPDRMTENETARVTFHLHNDSRLRKLLFRIMDELPEWLESDAPNGLLVRGIGGHESLSVSYALTPRKRGVYRVGPAATTAYDALGLFRFAHPAAEAHELIVYPYGADLHTLETAGVISFYGSVSSRSRIGDALEFHAIREYLPGDELRRIHWKSTARTGKFTVMEFEQNVAGTLTIALDLAEGWEFGEGKQTTLESAVRLAAALAKCALASGGAVRLLAHGRRDHSAVARQGLDELPHVLESLARAQADGPSPLAEVLERQAADLARGGVLLLTADPDPATLEFVKRLRGRGSGVGLVLLRGDSFAASESQHARAPQASEYEEFAAQAEALGVRVRPIYAGADPVLQFGGAAPAAPRGGWAR
jgi:uncharacterized protein (DUF58 family)